MWRGAATLIAMLLVWEVLARWGAGSFVFAGPFDVARYLNANAGLISRALAATLQSAAWGFLWGNLVAVTLASAIVLVPWSERMITLLALLVFCLPLVATGPILRVLFGPGGGPQITLAALAVYYTTFLALLVGLRAIPQSWRDLVGIYGRGRLTELLIVRARASLPYFIAGLQIAAPIAFLGAMIGEFTGAERGLGMLTLRAMRGLDVSATWAIASVATAVSLAVYATIGWIGQRLAIDRPALLLSASPPLNARSWPVKALSALGLMLLVLLLWQVSMDLFDLNSFFAKRPADVWRYLFQGDGAGAARATLFAALSETLSLTFPGYLAGLLLGAGVAAVLVLLPGLVRTVLPIAVALRSIPIVTTAPLIVLALGRGVAGTVTIVAVMIFFPTLVACLQGLRQTPGQVRDVFDSYAAGRFRLLIWAQIPVMLPAFFASARMAVPAALLAVTTAEWLATGRGIGNLMALTATTSNYNMLWSAIVALSLVAVLCYLAIEWAEQHVLGTYASEQVNR